MTAHLVTLQLITDVSGVHQAPAVVMVPDDADLDQVASSVRLLLRIWLHLHQPGVIRNQG